MGRWLDKVRGDAPAITEQEPETAGSVSYVSSISGGSQKSGRWLDRINNTNPDNKHELTKLTKPPSVSFVSCISGSSPKTKTIYRELIQACRGLRLLPSELKAGLDDDDLRDIEAGTLNREHLRAYARFLVENGHFCQLDREAEAPNREDVKEYHQPERTLPLDSPALRAARDRFYGHIFGCSTCNPNRGRYCREAWELREQYREPECSPDRRKARERTANHLKTCGECLPHVSRFCQIGQIWLETYSLTKLQIGPAYLPPPASSRAVLNITLKGWQPTTETNKDSAI
ncbi:MAG: hypothetical protein CMG82_14125 [Marinobacter sp.]|nr:hypothetical protein [Marinobacter sp.]